MKILRETVKQANPEEDLSAVIENYEELEYCFRYSDVSHFAKRREQEVIEAITAMPVTSQQPLEEVTCNDDYGTWSVLLPICSRTVSQQAKSRHNHSSNQEVSFDTNRFSELT